MTRADTESRPARHAEGDGSPREQHDAREQQQDLTVPLIATAAFCFAFQETSLPPAPTAITGHLPGATTSMTSFLESGYRVVAAIAAPTLGKIGDR